MESILKLSVPGFSIPNHASGGYRFLSARHCRYVSFNNSFHRFISGGLLVYWC